MPGRLLELRGLAIALDSRWATGIALSPDGGKLAVAIQGWVPRAPVFTPFAIIDVVDLRTQQTQSWPSPVTGYWAGAPSWTDQNTTLAFRGWHEAYRVMIGVDGLIVGFGQLNTADWHAPAPLPSWAQAVPSVGRPERAARAGVRLQLWQARRSSLHGLPAEDGSSSVAW